MAVLLEREDQLARLDSALAAAREGEGRLVVVEGPAGMGKTALLHVLRTRAEGAGMRVLRARGAELEQEFGYGIVRQLFEPPLMVATPEERADLLAGAAGLAAERLGFPGAAAVPGDGGGGGRPDAAFAVLHGLYWLCANLAARRPLVLSVDDAHWADASSLRFLVFLQTRLEELPVALIVATRPEYHGPARDVLPALAAEPAATLLQPPPLSAEAIAALVESSLGEAPDSAFTAACLQATRGTPFLVRQLLTALHEEQVRPVARSAPLVEHHGARTVARWILVRLDRLPDPAGRLARAVAVLERAELPAAAALAGLEPRAAAEAADELEAARILEPGRPLAFAHPIVRAAVYGELSGGERAEGHRRAAELLDGDPAAPERAAEHLLATEPAGDPWVVERLATAAAAAIAGGAPESAVTYLRRALQEPPPAETRGRTLLELGVAEVSAGRPDAEAHLRAALDALPPSPDRFTAGLSLAQLLARAQRSPDAIPVLERVAPGLGGDAELARTLEVAAASMALLHEGSAGPAAARLDALRDAVDDAGPAHRELLACSALWACLRNEPASVAAGLAERAIRASARPVPAPTDLPWFLQSNITLLWSDRFAAARRGLDAGLAEARETGDGVLLAATYSHRSLLFLRTGDFAAAEADARAALELPGSPAVLYRLMATTGLAESLLEQADLDGAELAIAAMGEAVEGGTLFAAMVRHVRGRVAIARRRPAEAQRDLYAAGAVLKGCLAVTPAVAPWRSEAALAELALGNRAAAARLVAEELELARAFGAPRALGIALRGSGAVAEGPAGEALLREALDILTDADVPIALAKTQIELGARLRRDNRRTEARRLLKLGLDTAHRLGAHLAADRAETELRATGAKPRRAVLTGVDALTASELRVAELAAQGLTNREIAQALFVTARTVEGHLTQVFRKLDVPSREALDGLLMTGAAS